MSNVEMRSLRVLLFIILATLLTSCRDPELARQAKVEKLVMKYSAYMIDKSVFADCKDGVKYLLQAIQVSASDTELPVELSSHLDKAIDIFRKTDIFNPEGIALLHKAYSLAHSGREFVVTKGLAPQNADAYARASVRKAIDSYKNGNAEETVRILLEMAIMTVTPVKST